MDEVYEFFVCEVGADVSCLCPEAFENVVVGHTVLAQCLEEKRICPDDSRAVADGGKP